MFSDIYAVHLTRLIMVIFCNVLIQDMYFSMSGITAMHTEQQGLNLPPSLPSTPKKGTVLPRSPVKMSTQMKASISALAKSDSSKRISLEMWLKSSKIQAHSPRKTPKKIVLAAVKTPTAKRKLCDIENYPPTSDNKRIKVDNSCEKGFLSGVKCLQDCSANFVTSDKDLVKKDLFSDRSSKLSLAGPSLIRSPTVNLPNYVSNPQPRTPIAPAPACHTSAPNWLQRMSASKKDISSSPLSENNRSPCDNRKNAKPTRKGSCSSKAKVGNLFENNATLNADSSRPPVMEKGTPVRISATSKTSTPNAPTPVRNRRQSNATTPVSNS